MTRSRNLGIALLLPFLSVSLAPIQANAAKPCNRDAGECRSQDAKRNANYDGGGGGICFKGVATANGATITQINATSQSACQAAGGKWESRDGGSDGGVGNKRP